MDQAGQRRKRCDSEEVILIGKLRDIGSCEKEEEGDDDEEQLLFLLPFDYLIYLVFGGKLN